MTIAQAVNNCSLALKVDPESSKALYRRAYALFAKKDNDGAKADLLHAQKNAPGDKAVATLLRKVWAALTLLRRVRTYYWFSVSMGKGVTMRTSISRDFRPPLA